MFHQQLCTLLARNCIAKIPIDRHIDEVDEMWNEIVGNVPTHFVRLTYPEKVHVMNSGHFSSSVLVLVFRTRTRMVYGAHKDYPE